MKQKVITVTLELKHEQENELQIVKQMQEEGWTVAQISTAAFSARTPHVHNALAITILFERAH